MTLSQCVNFLRDYAVSRGLTNLKYGIDEGRILSGVNSGQGSDALNSRSVGHMWQAGYDARMYKTMLDSDIDYFCVWSLSSDTAIGKGYPTVSYHVANSVSKMAGNERLNVIKSANGLPSGAEVEAFSSYDNSTGTMKLLSYNFKNSLSYSDAVNVNYNISMPEYAGKTVKVTFSPIDYNANYFDEWWADREKYGITNDKFNWSPDDPTIDSWTTLADPSSRDFYYANLRDKYIECAKLKSYQYILKLDSFGNAVISNTIGANMVSYYEISPADELDIAITNAENLNKNDYMDFSKVDTLLRKADNCSAEERINLAYEINEAVSLLVKNKRCGSSVSVNSNETNYQYAYLSCKLKINNADITTSETYSSSNDSGSRVYFLEGNDTYDFNGFHVWQRTYQDTTGPSAVFYVDRYSYSDLSQLGNIISAEFTTWGLNHQHSIGIANTNEKSIDGYYKTVSVISDKGKTYNYSLSAENGLYSSGSETSYLHTPDTALIQTSKSAVISGAVPQSGEQVTVRIGARTSAIDGYGWGNNLNYFCWTDVTFIGYDSSTLRQLMSECTLNAENYTDGLFENYMNAYQNAVSVLNSSYSQNEIDSAEATLRKATDNLVSIDNILRGDVNLDGSVNGMDAVLVKCILSELLGKSDLTEIQLIAADIDSNGKIDSDDVEQIEAKGIFL